MSNLILPKQLDSKKEIAKFVDDLIPNDISGDEAVKAIVLLKKLELVSEIGRKRVEAKAYDHIQGKKGFEVDGAKVATTEPKELIEWQYSEELEHLRESYLSEIEKFQLEIEKRKKLIEIEELKEQFEGTAKKIRTGEIKNGQIKVTINA